MDSLHSDKKIGISANITLENSEGDIYSSAHQMEENSNISVVIRIRPVDGAKISINIEDFQQNQILNIRDYAGNQRNFKFNRIYGPESQQIDIYNNIGKRVIDNAFRGYNCCIFAYGQTGSGKTHTMMGNISHNSANLAQNSDLGLIPRICEQLFNHDAENTEIRRKVEMSYVEIYSEEIYDLLSKDKVKVSVREDPVYGPYIKGCEKILVDNSKTILKLLEDGNKKRAVASTAMNDRSSRSHAILIIYFSQFVKNKPQLTSRINLIDLAGSEKVFASKVEGTQLKEAIEINKSLTALNHVIETLVKDGIKKRKIARQNTEDLEIIKTPNKIIRAPNSRQEKPRINAEIAPILEKLFGTAPNATKSLKGSIFFKEDKQTPNSGRSSCSSERDDSESNTSAKKKKTKNKELVNEKSSNSINFIFRSSILTWILKDSLGGNSKTYLIATISESIQNIHESFNTLRFASNSQQVVNKVSINKNSNDTLIKSLNARIKELTEMLKSNTDAEKIKRLNEELIDTRSLLEEQSKTWEQKEKEGHQKIAALEAELANKNAEIIDQRNMYEQKIAALMETRFLELKKAEAAGKSEKEIEAIRRAADEEIKKLADENANLLVEMEKKEQMIKTEASKQLEKDKAAYEVNRVTSIVKELENEFEEKLNKKEANIRLLIKEEYEEKMLEERNMITSKMREKYTAEINDLNTKIITNEEIYKKKIEELNLIIVDKENKIKQLEKIKSEMERKYLLLCKKVSAKQI